jgi:hypothetical protein
MCIPIIGYTVAEPTRLTDFEAGPRRARSLTRASCCGRRLLLRHVRAHKNPTMQKQQTRSKSYPQQQHPSTPAQRAVSTTHKQAIYVEFHSNATLCRSRFSPGTNIRIDKGMLSSNCRRFSGRGRPKVTTVPATIASCCVFHVQGIQALLHARSAPRVVAAVQSDHSGGVRAKTSIFAVKRVCVLRHLAAERGVALILEIIQGDCRRAQRACVCHLHTCQPGHASAKSAKCCENRE